MIVKKINEGINFDEQDFTNSNLTSVVFEQCNFVQCSFANMELLKTRFSECSFSACDFSMALLSETIMHDVLFDGCKLIGANFETINQVLMKMKFSNCNMSICNFYGVKLDHTIIDRCNLNEADFSNSDLSGIQMINSSLELAKFDQTILRGSNLEGSAPLSIDIRSNDLTGAKLSRHCIQDLLSHLNLSIVD